MFIFPVNADSYISEETLTLITTPIATLINSDNINTHDIEEFYNISNEEAKVIVSADIQLTLDMQKKM